MEITENFEYPLLPEWTTAEIIEMSAFYEAVEKLYTTGIKRADFLERYQKFCEIEPAKMTQKQLDKAFEKASGMSIYQAVKYAQQNQKDFICYK